ncbi:hypothetical protein HUJ04_001836 [Dendroctonus ponderosae]|nr:hypothetical protein HUJ04_001836 [Dendroctonus ponderosae]
MKQAQFTFDERCLFKIICGLYNADKAVCSRQGQGSSSKAFIPKYWPQNFYLRLIRYKLGTSIGFKHGQVEMLFWFARILLSPAKFQHPEELSHHQQSLRFHRRITTFCGIFPVARAIRVNKTEGFPKAHYFLNRQAKLIINWVSPIIPQIELALEWDCVMKKANRNPK